MSDVQTGMALGEIAAQVANSGECELTKFAFSFVRFVVHPSALQPNYLDLQMNLTTSRSGR